MKRTTDPIQPAKDDATHHESKVQAKEKPDYSWDENIKTILVAFTIAMIFRSLLFEPFHIPSGSMKSNLLINDYLFVSKYSYGYSRFSFPLSLPLFEGRIGSDNLPKRGDIVVFRPPKSPKTDFIKRVIGLPGDVVQISDGIVHINGLPISRKRAGSYIETMPGGHMTEIPRYIETLDNGMQYYVLDEVIGGPLDNTYEYHVPAGHYFLMGDNRDNSSDSRVIEEVGFVPLDHIIGRAELILFSVDEQTSIWKIWDWYWALRTDRLLLDIPPGVDE